MTPRDPLKTDHYTYFSQMANIHTPLSHGDNSKRLAHLRMQSLRARAVLAEPEAGRRSHGTSTLTLGLSISVSDDRSTCGDASPRDDDLARRVVLSPLAETQTSLPRADTCPVRQPASPASPVKRAASAAWSASVTSPTRSQSSSLAAITAQKAEMRRREACESLRFLVFGTVGTEGSRKTDRGAFHEQRIGTKEEVAQLHSIWVKMDEDGSGDVEFNEFLSFFSKSKADRLLGMRCVKFLVGNGENGEDSATGCTIEDMMQLIWLRASREDLDAMMRWFREAQYEMDRVPTPPLLSKKKCREILENFTNVREEGISFHDLLESGVADRGVAAELWEEFGDRDSTRITKSQLLEMLCPNGFRAHSDVRRAIDRDGRQLVHISNEYFEGWAAAPKAEDQDDD